MHVYNRELLYAVHGPVSVVWKWNIFQGMPNRPNKHQYVVNTVYILQCIPKLKLKSIISFTIYYKLKEILRVHHHFVGARTGTTKMMMPDTVPHKKNTSQ